MSAETIEEQSDWLQECLAHETRIFGPPGTGKTTRLTKEIDDFINVKKVQPSKIMVMSFTRAAAAELVGRKTLVPRQNVQTLHAAGYRALGGGEIAERHLDLWNKENPTLTLSYSSADIDDPAGGDATGVRGKSDELFNEYMTLRARNRLGKYFTRNDLAKLHKQWEGWKRANNFIDFQDMIDLPFERQLPPFGKPEVGIFDEFQDFTATEARLVRWWGAQMDICLLAGDDDQSIFAFKGASPENFINPPLPDDQIIFLQQSYRVPRAVQALAESWIRQLSQRQEKVYYPRRVDAKDPNSPIIEGEVRHIAATKISAGDQLIGSWQAPKKVLYDAMDNYVASGKSVMFLTTCAYMLEPLCDLLREEGIAFHNPYRTKRTDWNPLAAARGVSSKERLLAFLRLTPEVWGEDTRVWTIEDFKLWVEALKTKGVLRYHGKTGKQIEEFYDDLVTLDPDGLTRSLDVIDELSEWLTDEALNAAMSQNTEWFRDHLLASRLPGMTYPLNILEKHGAAALSQEPNIIVGTIHSVKGGAADAVYVFPDVSYSGYRAAFTEGSSSQRLAMREAYIRLFYVAMTRARESLIMCPAASKTAYADLYNWK